MNDQLFWCFIVGLQVDVDVDVDDECVYVHCISSEHLKMNVQSFWYFIIDAETYDGEHSWALATIKSWRGLRNDQT